jgi:hypothetical protein
MICYLLVGNKYRPGDALSSLERPFRGLHTIILSLRDGSVLPIFPGTSCQATFTPSLRDTDASFFNPAAVGLG